MKILVAYDGSACANDALYDLTRAGLPQEADVRILTVAETWLHEPFDPESNMEIPEENEDTVGGVLQHQVHNVIDDAQKTAEIAMRRVQKQFPGWQMEALVNTDSPALGILRMADLWKPDLIVVGSRGRSILTRLVMGSVSQKVLTEAHSSVRIARSRTTVEGSPERIVIGVDGTPDSDAAVRAVASRNWPAASAARVIAVHAPIESAVPPFGSYMSLSIQEAIAKQYEMLEEVATNSAALLRDSGLNASSEVIEGTPIPILLRESEHWGADSIFVGARGHGFLERFLLGSVSSALAGRAHCSVEVVRTELPKGA
jgi:nucleotide-binding universal stress UspA family protein